MKKEGNRSVPLRKWRWPLTKPYNGFTPQERVRGWQVTCWLLDSGILPIPKTCEICGGGKKVAYHNENYYEPWKPHPVCGRCHFIIHNRHRHPGLLAELKNIAIEPHKRWIHSLMPNDTDLASSPPEYRSQAPEHLEENIKYRYPNFPLEQLY